MQVIEQEILVSVKFFCFQLDLFDDVGIFVFGFLKYKDNFFFLGESFGFCWDIDVVWGMDRVEEKELEVIILSIWFILERVINWREVESWSLGFEFSEVCQKFVGVKVILFDMFFGWEMDVEYEVRFWLQQFLGSNVISFLDFFGDMDGVYGVGSVFLGNVLFIVDIVQFKQGVKFVVGKMVVLVNGVMNFLQDCYGFY